MKKPTQPTLNAALYELNKKLGQESLRDFIKNGNIGLLRTSNPRDYSEIEWNDVMNYLKENVEVEIVARVK
jgi:hypothetical protein